MPPLGNLVHGVDENHGPKKDLVLMDNNIVASARFKEVIAEICDLGFTRGATFANQNKKDEKRRVDFNQGVDARILSKSPMYLREMAKICISPLRIAFDHLGLKQVYETSVRMAADNDITSLSNYMLYNFMDTPADLHERMSINISLNEELGIRIWSFPMRYLPVNLKDRSHVGRNWNRYYLRSFQIMLQATRGIVSGSPDFFRRAYGKDAQEFKKLLSYPLAFIFYREYFENGLGRPARDEYEALRQGLSASQERELVQFLAEPPNEKARRERYQQLTTDSSTDSLLRQILRFHLLDARDRSRTQWQQIVCQDMNDGLLEEEVVEDAGLFDHI